MTTRNLDQETERLLTEILGKENTTRDELIKNLIRDRWDLLQQSSKNSQPDGDPVAENELPTRPRNHRQTIAQFIRCKRFR